MLRVPLTLGGAELSGVGGWPHAPAPLAPVALQGSGEQGTLSFPGACGPPNAPAIKNPLLTAMAVKYLLFMSN